MVIFNLYIIMIWYLALIALLLYIFSNIVYDIISMPFNFIFYKIGKNKDGALWILITVLHFLVFLYFLAAIPANFIFHANLNYPNSLFMKIIAVLLGDLFINKIFLGSKAIIKSHIQNNPLNEFLAPSVVSAKWLGYVLPIISFFQFIFPKFLFFWNWLIIK